MIIIVENIVDSTIEKKLRKLQDNERSIFKTQTFGIVKLKNKLQIQIEEEVNKYLKKIKSNLDA
ncbi:hypothetical protein [Portibacter marinus]|uniref:hypothetical protein n=1 Tax=Portibacter marinus TaxID=2898660 RepID=UPI001F264E3D|nr:hypothetical protein [Portibacter marinus]